MWTPYGIGEMHVGRETHRRCQTLCEISSTVTGTANFADSYVPAGYKQGFSACVGGLNIFCGILGTLMSFLKYAEVYEAHRIAAVSWSSLGRSIQIELALKEERRKNCRDFLKVSRAEYDRLLESSPTIDQDIIALFNKRFNKDYPRVCKPIVCNGLREVRVLLLMSAVAHAMHYCGGDDCESDEDETPSTMYS